MCLRVKRLTKTTVTVAKVSAGHSEDSRPYEDETRSLCQFGALVCFEATKESPVGPPLSIKTWWRCDHAVGVVCCLRQNMLES